MKLSKKLFLFILPLIGVLFLLAIYAGGYFAKPHAYTSPTTTQKPINLSSDKLFSIVNEWRQKEGYQQYVANDLVCNLAKIRTKEVVSNWSHDGFFKHRNDFQHKGLGENLSRGQGSETETLQDWLNSPTHRENLERDFTHSCIKCSGSYCVQIFANF